MKNILKFGINGNVLKIIAIIAMVIDHIGFYFSPFLGNELMLVCRYIGRIAMPIFTYLIVQGFFHTKDFKKYLLRLLLCASITQIALWLIIGINIKYVPQYTAANYEHKTLNTLFTYAISLVLMKIMHEKLLVKKWDYNKNMSFKAILIILLVLVSVILPIDYGESVVVLTILLYLIERLKITFMINTETIREFVGKIIKIDQLKVIHIIYVALIFISILLVTLFLNVNIFALFAILPIALYNGERGNKSEILKKCFYYVFAFQHVALYSVAMLLMLT